jgi:radical SAM superfamily enzyme YgiQ (UPF0313 family)
MRILFVSANREMLPDPVVPLGVLQVMGAVSADHETALADLCFESDPLAYLTNQIVEFQPELIAVGMRNIQNADYTDVLGTLGYYDTVFTAIRATTTAPVVLGGGGFSVVPRELMQRFRANFGISGEGELVLRRLVEEVAKGGRDFSNIPGLHYFDGDRLVSNAPSPTYSNLDLLPRPRRDVVDPRYYAYSGTESVQTKRGCAMRCEYCTYPSIEGRQVRTRAPELVVEEMAGLRRSNPQLGHFFIVDSVFNIPPAHAKAVCRGLIERGFDVPWTCYTNPNGFDAELAQLMRRAGCIGMEVGADAGNDVILKRLKKGFDTAGLKRMHRLSTDAGLVDCHTFLLGTPGETMTDVEKTLEFIVDLDPSAAILMVYKDDRESIDAAVAEQRRALREETLELLRTHRLKFPRWVIPALKVNFDVRLFRVLRKYGLKGPLWQHNVAP